MIEDGYTEEVLGVPFRRLLSKERDTVVAMVRDGKPLAVETKYFKSPYVFPVTPLTEFQKQELFTQLLEYPHEQQDLDNLLQGVRLYLTQPLLAVRTCDTCREWWFDEETGLVSKRAGECLPRPSHAPTACDTDRGCPKGHYSNPQGMSDKNQRAFNHYLEWKAVGCPHPECPIIRRNWMYIEGLIAKHGHPGLHD